LLATGRQRGRLRIIPADGGAPLWNIYETGWRPGVLRVRAEVTFTVLVFDPGAVLRIRNVVVA
jgi:hypothetical protein